MTTADTGPLPFRTAAVLGAGVMGAQIAAHLANAGLNVHLLDIPGPDDDRDAVVKQGFATALKLTPNPFFSEEVSRRIALGNFDDHLDRIAEADWVIEVVVEKLEIKQRLMERVEGAASPDAVISTTPAASPSALSPPIARPPSRRGSWGRISSIRPAISSSSSSSPMPTPTRPLSSAPPGSAACTWARAWSSLATRLASSATA